MRKKQTAPSDSLMFSSFFETIGFFPGRQKIMAAGSLFLMVGGLFTWFLLAPKYNEMDRVQTEMNRIDMRLASAGMRPEKVLLYENELKKRKKRVHELMSLFPDSNGVASLLSDISKTGQNAGVAFLLFEPQPEEKTGSYIEIPTRIQATGTFSNLSQFFYAIARLPKMVAVKNLSMTPSEKEGVIIASFVAVIHRMPSETDPPL